MTSRWPLWLALPFVLYLVPLLGGYAWSSISPMTPNVTAFDGYGGRTPELPITVETYGTGVVAVPFQSRLRQYFRATELPLWNPYQGLGQPFAAQGEGSPYFPLAIVRSLLPYRFANVVTVFGFYVSAVFMFLFLRGLGCSSGAALLGGAGWSVSGALTLHIARPNIADQVAMIPPLFWAAAWAVRSGRVVALAALAVAAGLHALAGFVQIAANALVLLGPFIGVYAWVRAGPGAEWRGWLRRVGPVMVALLLGNALAAFYLLPLLEAMRVTANKNSELLGLLPMPWQNVLAFFMPLIFGQFFQSWAPGRYPDVVDWNNLYAHGSIGLLLLVVLGAVHAARADRQQRLLYLFFAGALVFFLLRYISFPPLGAFNLLPLLSRQSPKHATGVAVFCLIVAAAFAVEWLRARPQPRERWLLLALLLALLSSLGTHVGQRGGFEAIDGWDAIMSVGVTLLTGAALVGVIRLARARREASLSLVLAAVVVAELSLYLPLGNGQWSFLALRLVLATLVIAAGLLLAWRWQAAAALGVAAIGLYAWLIVAPRAGLPERFDVDAPPAYLAWLRVAAGREYRSFGTQPDFSTLGGVQDIGVVGPLATAEYAYFIDLVSTPAVARHYRSSSTFSVGMGDAGTAYDLAAYPRARPIFDWLGLRYIVLDRSIFNQIGRPDHRVLYDPALGLGVAYEDTRVVVLESTSAQPRAIFAPGVEVIGSQEEALRQLSDEPERVFGAPMIELGAEPDVVPAGPGEQQAVPIDVYRANSLSTTFEAPSAGIFVVKDSYFPGWQATLNGRPAEVVRVNGLVRGVMIPAAGRHDVVMQYRPRPFVYGVWLAGGVAAFIALAVAYSLARSDYWGQARRRYARPGSSETARPSASAAPDASLSGTRSPSST